MAKVSIFLDPQLDPEKPSRYNPAIRVHGLGFSDFRVHANKSYDRAQAAGESLQLRIWLQEVIETTGLDLLLDNVQILTTITLGNRIFSYQGRSIDDVRVFEEVELAAIPLIGDEQITAMPVTKNDTLTLEEAIAIIQDMVENVENNVSTNIIAAKMTATSKHGCNYNGSDILALCSILRDFKTNGYLIEPKTAKALIEHQETFGVHQEDDDETLSVAEIKAMMQDPKYWKHRDPDHINKVSAGFRKLYGE